MKVAKLQFVMIFVIVVWVIYTAVAVDLLIGDAAVALDLQTRADFRSALLPKEVWWLAGAIKLMLLIYLSVLAWRVAGGRLSIARFVLLALASTVALVLSSFLAWITTFGAIM